MQGIGQVVHELVQHISTGGRQVYPFRCDPVIHKLVQHISTEGGSEQEGNLSFQVLLYKGLQYMLFCMVMLLSKVIDVDHQNSSLFTTKCHFSSPLSVLIGVLAKFHE